MRGVAVPGGFRHRAGASVLTIVAVSPPRGASVLPALPARRRLPTTISLSKLNHAAHGLAVYASQLSFPLSRSYGHARLASGWWPAFTGRGSQPRKVPNEVSASSTWLPPHPSFATQAGESYARALSFDGTSAAPVHPPQLGRRRVPSGATRLGCEDGALRAHLVDLAMPKSRDTVPRRPSIRQSSTRTTEAGPRCSAALPVRTTSRLGLAAPTSLLVPSPRPLPTRRDCA